MHFLVQLTFDFITMGLPMHDVNAMRITEVGVETFSFTLERKTSCLNNDLEG